MFARFNTSRVFQVFVEEVPESEVNKFGIVDLDGSKLSPGESAKIHGMVEKPAIDGAPSNLSVVGRYVLSEKIWELLELTPAGAGDEVQLTDAIATLMNLEQVDAYYMKGKNHDCGSKLGYFKANVEYGLRHKELGENFKEFI